MLLSTYNGEQYLSQQMESILAQEDVDLSVLIRDDGSKDNTISILNDYCSRYNNIMLMDGNENLHSGNSFMKLLYQAGEHCSEKYDFYAFADQDDIWLKHKLSRAIELLEACGNTEESLLYCSNQTIYKNGTQCGLRFDGAPELDLTSVINSNKVSGCTLVMNKALMDQICSAPHPGEGLMLRRMHDVWVVIAALCSGKVVYDEQSYILYRIHDNNVVGIKKKSAFEQIKIYWKNLTDKAHGNYRSWTAQEALRAFPKTQGRNREVLEELSYYRTDPQMKKKLLRDIDTLSKIDVSVFKAKIKIVLNLL